MPADVAGPMEVHEYRSDSEHSDADEDLETDAGPSKNRPLLVAPIYPETMSRSRFLEIKKYLHLANNENLSNNKTAKVDPLYHKLLLNCQQFGIFYKKLSINESMMPYRGKHPIKQFIQNKPMICGTEAAHTTSKFIKVKRLGQNLKF